MLWPLYTEIIRLTSSFSHIDYSHVYRQQNQEADVLSKSGVEMAKRTQKI
jgi:hypothetical protein